MNTNDLIALGILAQLAFAVAHHFIKSPRQQAQLDAIEQKVNGVLMTVTGAAGISTGSATATAGKEAS